MALGITQRRVRGEAVVVVMLWEGHGILWPKVVALHLMVLRGIAMD
jgi:hypothetical protein